MKKIAVFIVGGVMAISLCLNTALAKDTDQEIPDQSGIYDVPGHPSLKVRVFVHYPKLKESKLPQCSVDDPESSAVVDTTGWKLPSVWPYNLNVSSVPASVRSANLANLAKEAFDRWSMATGLQVKFVREKDTTISKKNFDGKNIIAWGSAPGSALAVTYTWYYPSSGLVAEVDTIMNKKFAWSWTPYSETACPILSTYDAQDILTHELGHWMGLDDHYTDNYENNTMYGYGSKGEIKKDTLTEGDESGLNKIYP